MTEQGSESRAFAFLFTDIEGSTRRWEQSPEAMARALAQHDAILQAAVRTHGGEIYRSAGDAVQALFPDAQRAALAAVEAQRALVDATWEVPGGMRVRMAMHVASGQRTETGDYRSPELRRLDAVLSLAHGGQMLLTRTAAAQLRSELPPELTVVDLGRWQLPNVGLAESIAQLQHPRLPSEFAPFDAPSVERLPPRPQTGRFIGRRRELAELHRLLDQPDIRLITLIGPGGIGKTRLAQELAQALQAAGATPLEFVELVGLTEPERVISTIAAALHVQEFGHSDVSDALVDFLRDRPMLLMLDNFEHLLPAAEGIASLLARLPHLRIVITSRSPLRITGEWQLPVEPLSVPSSVQGTWAELDLVESVELFHDRALAVGAGFAFEPRHATAVAQICQKLEGVPLAIELAAPLVRLLTMEELDERLNDRLGLRRDAQQPADSRHQALRASIAWSYELLSPESRAFLRRLGVLRSGFTLETLDGLFGDQFDVLAQVEVLVEQNLVHQGGFQRMEDSFYLLESVRQFALESLDAAGELEDTRARHAAYFSAAMLDHYPDQRDFDAEAVGKLSPVMDDLHQAIEWTLATDPARALTIAAGAWRLWFIAGQLDFGDRWIEPVLDATAEMRTVDRVRALYGLGLLRCARATIESSIEMCQASEMLALAIDDQRGIGDACNYIAGMIGETYRDFPRAESFIARAIVAYESVDDRHGLAETMLNRASINFELGRLDEALEDGERLLAYCRAEGKDVLASNSIHGVAGIAFFAGNQEHTRVLLIEAFELNRRMGYDLWLGGSLSVLNMLLVSLGRYEEACRLIAFAHVFSEVGPGNFSLADPFARNDEIEAEVLRNLAPDVFERVTADGERLTPAEAVDQALYLLNRLSFEHQPSPS